MKKYAKLVRIMVLIGTAISLVFVPIVVDALRLDNGSAQAGNSAATSALPALTEVTYVLDWEWGQAVPLADEQGWRVTNNLGYEITVEHGYLVNRNIELVACEHEDTVSKLLWQSAWPQAVLAGHGNTEHDKSKITAPFVESLAVPTRAEVETTFGIEPAYCQAHYLVALGVETARNLPTDVDMLGKTLYIEGTYKAASSDTPVAFVIATELAWGAITDLLESEAMPTTIDATQSNQVIIRRNLGLMFDQVDFDHMPQAEQAKSALRSLINATQIVVNPAF